MLQHLGMAGTDDNVPLHVGLPDNVARMRLPNRRHYANQITSQVVDMIIHKVTYPPPQPPPILVQVPGQPPVVVQLPPHNNARPAEPQGDDMHNYCKQLLEWGLHLQEFLTAIKVGDIDRHKVNVKRMIPFFYASSSASRYAMELINFITKVDIMLPPQTALRVQLGSFVNPKGGAGNNKAADMHQENNIKDVKEVIRGLGASKTDKAMKRISKAAPVVKRIASNLRDILAVKAASGRHVKKTSAEDIAAVQQSLRQQRPFQYTQGRQMHAFSGIRADPFLAIDEDKFLEFVSRHAKNCVLNF